MAVLGQVQRRPASWVSRRALRLGCRTKVGSPPFRISGAHRGRLRLAVFRDFLGSRSVPGQTAPRYGCAATRHRVLVSWRERLRVVRLFCRSSGWRELTVCHSRLQPTRKRYTSSYLRAKDALARCRRRVKWVRFLDMTWEAKGKTHAPHIRGFFARGPRFLLVPVTNEAAPDVLFV